MTLQFDDALLEGYNDALERAAIEHIEIAVQYAVDRLGAERVRAEVEQLLEGRGPLYVEVR